MRQPARLLVLIILLYASVVLVGVQPVTDPDIWWHLRTGEWIVEHRTVPTVDPFSTYGFGKPWVDYSWLFDVGLYALHRGYGLRGISVYRFGMCLAILLALHRLVALAEPRPARGAALTALAFFAMAPIFSPRSYLVSIVFFIVVLHAVLVARRSGRVRPLLLLPVLFVVWANVHIQFVYGLLVLVLATLDRAIGRWRGGTDVSALPLKAWIGVDIACVLATFVTPYHVHLYRTLHDVAGQTGVYWFNTEMRALQFRHVSDWVALGLALAAAFVLGRRPPPRFVTLLAAMGVFISFRSGRDVWFVVVSALLIISISGSHRDPLDGEAPRLGRGTRWRAASTVTLIFAMMLARQPESALQGQVRREYPADAARAVEEGNYTGPLYNHFNWGGYFIWRLPHLRVAMDGRSHVHGDERIVQSMRTWAGVGDWRADPELSAAGVVIAAVDMPLASLLRRDDRFREVYADGLARVFVAEGRPATPDRHR